MPQAAMQGLLAEVCARLSIGRTATLIKLQIASVICKLRLMQRSPARTPGNTLGCLGVFRVRALDS